MSHVGGGDNREIPDGPEPPRRLRLLVLAAAGAAWLVTMAGVLRSEVLATRDSPDVRALVESARLTRQHAAARWVVRAGDTVLGTFSSAVSGSRDEEQLAYVVEGELHAPLSVRAKGVLVATWDRKPERLALDVELAGARHRVDGALDPGGDTFRLRYAAPGVPKEEAATWDIDEVPLLGPGPVPLPAIPHGSLAEGRSGVAEGPPGAGDLAWSLSPARKEAVTIGARTHRVTRHDLEVRGVVLTAWIDESGLPVRIQLPGGVVAELAEDER